MRKIIITKLDQPAEINPVNTNSKTKPNLLGHIEKIVEMSENSGLSDEFFSKAKTHINYLKRRLHLNDIQAVFLSLFVDKSCDCNISLNDIACTLKCRMVRLLQYENDIETLEKRRFIRCSRRRDSQSYRVPKEVIDALKKNEEYQPVNRKNVSIHELFDLFATLFEERKNDELTFENMLGEIEILLDENSHLDFTKKLDSYSISSNNLVLLLYFCHLFVENNDNNIGFHDFDDLFGERFVFRHINESLSKKYNELFDFNLIECTNEDGFEDRESFKLTDKAKNELLGELNIFEKQAQTKRNLILHTNLVAKKMFYNKNEHIQIKQLTELLSVENFKNICTRLADKGMRTGFACLFHGGPGTGKTETVYQIARETGRDIFMVDISQTKSMWFGESEKKIKAIFEQYKALVKIAELAPILLFNEADAIINKRKDTATGSVAQTENAIQNIILQEMENLEGIMIATTNLTQNLDKAFERRFLYKIEFLKPGLTAKKSIWQSVFPQLLEQELETLANNYDFSGGQIENISRKCTVDSIISGEEPAFETLISHCQNELLTKTQQRIGFKN